MAKAVAAAQNPDGSLPGLLQSASWQPESPLDLRDRQFADGDQLAAACAGDGRRRVSSRTARRANRFNMGLQDLAHADPGVRGALKGSHPINGDYMTWRYPNWAAKFFMDALMLERLHDRIDNIG